MVESLVIDDYSGRVRWDGRHLEGGGWLDGGAVCSACWGISKHQDFGSISSSHLLSLPSSSPSPIHHQTIIDSLVT